MNRIIEEVRGIPRRIAAVNLAALARWFTALALLTIATFAPAASWDDDSHYVSLGPRSGYYIVRPSSRLSHQLGVEAAPTSDTADPFRHGYGADALAFHFNLAGVLSASIALLPLARFTDNADEEGSDQTECTELTKCIETRSAPAMLGKIALSEQTNPSWLDLSDDWEQEPKFYDRPWETAEMI